MFLVFVINFWRFFFQVEKMQGSGKCESPHDKMHVVDNDQNSLLIFNFYENFPSKLSLKLYSRGQGQLRRKVKIHTGPRQGVLTLHGFCLRGLLIKSALSEFWSNFSITDSLYVIFTLHELPRTQNSRKEGHNAAF